MNFNLKRGLVYDWATREIIEKLDFHKIEAFVHQKALSRKRKKQPTEWD